MGPLPSNSCQALATDDWLWIVTMRILRSRTYSILTALFEDIA